MFRWKHVCHYYFQQLESAVEMQQKNAFWFLFVGGWADFFAKKPPNTPAKPGNPAGQCGRDRHASTLQHIGAGDHYASAGRANPDETVYHRPERQNTGSYPVPQRARAARGIAPLTSLPSCEEPRHANLPAKTRSHPQAVPPADTPLPFPCLRVYTVGEHEESLTPHSEGEGER